MKVDNQLTVITILSQCRLARDIPQFRNGDGSFCKQTDIWYGNFIFIVIIIIYNRCVTLYNLSTTIIYLDCFVTAAACIKIVAMQQISEILLSSFYGIIITSDSRPNCRK